MSSTEDREAVRDSPFRARSLFTVAAAICLARFVDAPCFFALSLMCSYWRSRLSLHAFRGMWRSPLLVAKGELPRERLSKRASASGRRASCCCAASTSLSSMQPPGLPGPTPPVLRAHRPSRLPTRRGTTAPHSETLEATGRPNFPEACASSCSIAQTRAYAVRFYACAFVPASVVHVVHVHETCNERKEDVGRFVCARYSSGSFCTLCSVA